MKFHSTLIFPVVTLISSTLSNPIIRRQSPLYEELTFTFWGGGNGASYQLSFPADGNYYYTNNSLSISAITTNGFDGWRECDYLTPFDVTIAPAGTIDGQESYGVGPPQPITAVNCLPTAANNGTCLPIGAICEWPSENTGMTYWLDCCSGPGWCVNGTCPAA